MNKAAVIGFPVKHSLSPKLHGYWLKKYGIDGEYGYLETPKEELQKTIERIRKEYKGANVTVPYKQEVIQYMDELTDVAKKIGAVNTIINKDGRLIGDNTDWFGFTENIRATIPGFEFEGKLVVVLGAGGAARAVVAGLIKSGVKKVILTNRTIAKAEEIQAVFPTKVEVAKWEDRNDILSEADLLANTTLLGMTGQEPLEIDLEKLPPHAVVNDIVYKPLITKLLSDAKDKGNQIVDGLGMLLYQAQPGFKAWFGKEPEVDEKLKEIVLG